MVKNKLLLVDGNSILNRAFYAIGGARMLSTSDGTYTNAVYGFVNVLNRHLEEEDPEYLCVSFDLKAPTFRHLDFDGYKAQRKGMPPELASQVPIVKEVLDAMNIKRAEMEGFEADDIIGALSLEAERKGMEVVILTGDRDTFQLVSERTHVKLITTRGGKTETEEYDPAALMEKYGIPPQAFIELKGLMGDSSDNIPGVPGIGEKTALELIKQFGSIDNLYEKLEQVERKSVKNKLEAGRDLAYMSKRLAAIQREIPGLCPVEDLKRREIDRQRLYELFTRLEFKSLIEKLNLRDGAAAAFKEKEEISVEVIDRAEELDRLVKEISLAGEAAMLYIMEKSGPLSFRLWGIALCWPGGNGVYIRVGEGLKEEEFLEKFKPLLENEEIKKFGHSLKEFILYLKVKGLELKGLAFDSMIGAYLIDPSRSEYAFANLVREYLGADLEPFEQVFATGKASAHGMASYPEKLPAVFLRSCRLIRDLCGKLNEKLKENSQEMLYYEIELPLVEVLADMEYHGFKVDLEGLKAFEKELEEGINRLTLEIYRLAGEEFNINSTKQLGSILYEKLNLPAVKKTKTGHSTDAETLEQLSDMHEIVPKVLEYRQLMKLKSTYVEGLLSVVSPGTGKIHSSFNQTVTTTGRISSTEPNLQNIPVKLELGRKIRKVFVPSDESFVLLAADYSQIELRILAHISGDENMIEAFKNNEDIHAATASRVFGVPKEEVTSLLRSRAKAVNFGIVYGISDFSLSKDLGITVREARKYIDEYLNRYPGVRRYMQEIVRKGTADGYVTTLFKRRRYLPELKSGNHSVKAFGQRAALNTPIQGSAADIIKIAMVKVFRELKRRGFKSRLILQVHDELIVETLREEKEQVEAILRDCMESAASLKVPLLVELKWGDNWYETK